MSNDPPVTIATFMFLYQAQIAQGALKDAGIGSFIPEGNTVGMAPHYANAVGGVRLQVRESDAEAARAVLNDTSYEAVAEFETDEDAVGTEGDVDRPAEPRVPGSWEPGPDSGLLTGRPGFLLLGLVGFVILLGIGLFFLGRGSQTTPEAPEPCEVAWKSKNWDDTLAWCSELTQARPQFHLGWIYLSQAMTERGLHGEAVVAAREGARYNWTGWCYLARALHFAGHDDESEAALQVLKDMDKSMHCNVDAPAGITPY